MTRPTNTKPQVVLPRGAARDALVRALAALLLEDEQQDQLRDRLRRMKP